MGFTRAPLATAASSSALALAAAAAKAKEEEEAAVANGARVKLTKIYKRYGVTKLTRTQ